MTLSQSSLIPVIAAFFGTTISAFGVNAILRPAHALSMFEFDYPTSAPIKQLVDYLMIIYGIRDIYIGIAIFSTTYYGHRKALGWNLLGLAGTAFVDGVVCKMNGHGEWNHWSYAPMVAILGCLSLGALDFA
ncbi:hypothetical protein BGW36DRAFT_388734 [Talaromyces proteolyticus]|uniref:Uncharacterized protein n=1 Tax=Talaromyces proteolyticus TaxID=1131652 RepID=A0AAD4PW92_9EURO|nr:uncharacterized protein BGW36DRAFT_388734 [Talaromyces proteolyticus]KAH8691657.1 hypothetical protein BGW36DRAFT_388734 [Talaromyces proteolyticus]